MLDEPEYLYGVFRADDVCVADNNEGRRGKAADRVRWNILELKHAPGGLVMKQSQVLRVWCNLEIFLLQFLWHVLQPGIRHRVPEPRIRTVALKEGLRQYELAHGPRMPYCHLHGNGTAIAKAKEIGFFDVQVVQQRRGIVG